MDSEHIICISWIKRIKSQSIELAIQDADYGSDEEELGAGMTIRLQIAPGSILLFLTERQTSSQARKNTPAI